MTITTEQLAEILAGIVRSQQAIIDSIEGETAGWRNRHLLSKLNVAGNLRLATPRLIDIPSRILLRSQGRVPMDVATIMRDLEVAMAGGATVPTADPVPAPAAAVAPAADSGDDLDFNKT